MSGTKGEDLKGDYYPSIIMDSFDLTCPVIGSHWRAADLWFE